MNLIIKGRKGLKVPVELQRYIENRFQKFEPRLKEPAIVEIMLADVRGPQGGIDKVVHLTATLPGLKKPQQIEEISEDFRQSIDLVHSRFAKFVRRWKEKSKIGTRYPKKYYIPKKIKKE